MPANTSQSNQNSLHSPLAEVVEQLTDWDEILADSQTGSTMHVEAVKLEMPLELGVQADETGKLSLNGSAPTQTVETTIMPVFHRLKLRVEVDYDD
ncbi:MAG: hypothetical protein F6J89_21625 [Symploca sp. SIO1C4]|uniref:Uncharacterized protein n=1 Tax=Symploca sp. SIO1C4 TaxID=2607765 RepID=A0A6B3N962_9CYAN|nr:hypothetical protein [Symploca sp. SIO1C4]